MSEETVVLVTGAGAGLGREVARQLAPDHHVIVTARDPGRARIAAADIGAHPLEVGLDVTDPDSVARAFAAVEAGPGRLDVLVNNAAAYVDWSETASAADLAAAHTVMETNLYGAWRTTQAFLPLLRRSPAGRVVNVSSGAGSQRRTA